MTLIVTLHFIGSESPPPPLERRFLRVPQIGETVEAEGRRWRVTSVLWRAVGDPLVEVSWVVE